MRNILLVLLLTVSCLNAAAQKSQESGEENVELDKYAKCSSCAPEDALLYDADCKKFYVYKNSKYQALKRLGKLRAYYNKELRLKIININRYIYNAGFIVDDIDFGSETPAIFNQLFLGQGDWMTTLISKAAGMVETDTASLLKKLRNFKYKYDNLLQKKIQAHSICDRGAKCCEDIQSVDFPAMAKELFEIKLEFGEQSVTIKQELAEAKEDLATLKKNKAPDDEIEDQESLVRSLESVQADFEKLFASFAQLTDEDLMRLVLFNNNFVADHYRYISPSIYPQGNRLSIKMGITARDSSLVRKWNIMPVVYDSVFIDIPVLLKPFVSFSVGPFFGLSEKLKSDEFEAKPKSVGGVVSDSAKYEIVSTGPRAGPLGIAALGTFGMKLSNMFGLGISAGAGVNIQPKPRPAYLAGLTVFAGDRQQFNLTGGMVITQVDRLRTGLYESGVVYDARPEISYNRKTETGFFLSLTYTVFTPSSRKGITSQSR